MRILLAVLTVFGLPALAVAQDAAPELAVTLEAVLKALVIPLTPVVVWLIRLGLKRLPRSLVPMLVPFVGMALELVAARIAGGEFTGWAGIALGAVGAWLRAAIGTPLKYGRTDVNPEPKLLS